jgi:hypothetical protein
MLLVPPPKIRQRRSWPGAATAVAPVAPLSLLSAVYDPVGLTLTLSFDRAVSVAGMVGSQLTVSDGVHNGHVFAATGLVAVNAGVVQVGLVAGASAKGPKVLFSAGAGNGIVAVNDGGKWAGATGLVLPYSS